MKALIAKEFRELARDRRTLAMLVVLPILLLVIFGYAADFAVDRVTVTIVGAEAEALSEEWSKDAMATDRLDIVGVDSTLTEDDAERVLRDQESDVVVVVVPDAGRGSPLSDRIRVVADGSALFTAQAAQATFVQLAAKDALSPHRLIEAQGETQAPAGDLDDLVTVLFNPDLETSWVMVPGLIGLILTFIGTLITSVGLVRERETGTLEQLAVMPLRPSAIILGKITPYFLLALIDMAAVTLLGTWLFKVPFLGSVLLFAVSAVVFCFVVLGIGVLVSSVSQNTGQAIQLALMFVVPQVLLSGLIFPLDSMPLGVRWLGYALPLTWFREIAQGVMLRDADLSSLWLPLVVLTAMAVLAFGAATARMRYSLTHGGAR